MARLLALFGPRRGVAWELDRRTLVGRSPEAGVQLIDQNVSREHCVIETGPEGHNLVDLGSRNGTWLNGGRLEGQAPLRAGDQIAVGESVLVYEPSFEALLSRDGESTLVLTEQAASGARSAGVGAGDWLARAGELAMRAAMAGSPAEAAALLASAVQQSFEAESVAVLLVRPDGSLLPALAQPAGAHLSVGRALVELCLRQGRALAMAQAQAFAEADATTTRVRTRQGEVLCAPAFALGAPVAALCATRARPFEEKEIALAAALAAAAGPALVRPEQAEPREPGGGDEALPVAESASMREAMRLAGAAAQVASTVLVRGETGTGKEEIARAIHALGARRRGPFVALNCGAIPSELAESELFGHEKGAFTGALAAREGVFERADGGTLFLDEVAELAPALQVKLLRALQDKRVQRVGGRAPIPVDVRVVAATHRDLAAMLASGAFREDLYWRLNVLQIPLAPLRERTEDVLPLAARFLRRLSRELGRSADGFTPEARDALLACPWPGNVRQLANALERALVLKTGAGPIALADLPPEVLAPAPAPTPGASASAGKTLGELIQALEKEQVVLALRRARGVKSAAAEALGISRPTLDRKIEEYKIDLFQ